MYRALFAGGGGFEGKFSKTKTNTWGLNIWKVVYVFCVLVGGYVFVCACVHVCVLRREGGWMGVILTRVCVLGCVDMLL